MRRRFITVTRTVLVNGSTCSSHTRSSSVSGLTTAPSARSSTCSTPNSFGLSVTERPSRVTSWRAGIQAHAGALEDGLLGHRVAALQRVQPRHDLGEGERLGQVVVGAEVEPLDARADVGGRGEHEDPRRALGAHELAADLVAVDVGQVAVEHDDVVVDDGRALERLVAVEGDVDGESVAAKAARERLGEPGLVFGDEDAHGHGAT